MKNSTKKSLITILMTVLVASGCLFAAGCNGSLARTLEMPQNVILEINHSRAVTQYLIKWDAVEGAEKYRLLIDGVEVESKTTTLDATNYLTPGVYAKAYVQAVGNGFSTADSALNKALVHPEIVSQALIFQKNEDEKTYSAISYSAEKDNLAGKIVFPDYYNESPVTKIGDYAFCDKDVTGRNPVTGQNCNTYTSSFRFPKFLTSVGEYAFAYCTAIKEIKLPDTVTEIGKASFAYCTRLSSVTAKGIDNIETYTFYGCKSLSNVTTADDLKTVDLFSFDDTRIVNDVLNADIIINDSILYSVFDKENITEYTVPENVKIIAGGAFQECTKLTSITVPEGVKLGGIATFMNCTSLESASLSSDTTEIPDYTFGNCKKLKDFVIPNGVTRIGEYAFAYCSSLFDPTPEGAEKKVTSFTIPDEVTEIGTYAFMNCKFTDVNLSSKLQTIGANAFFGNSSLNAILLPEGITELSEYALAGLRGLSMLLIPSTVKTIDKTCLSQSASNTIYFYYYGDSESYGKITLTDASVGVIFQIDPTASFNKAIVLYYSETEPKKDDADYYWRYYEGKPITWAFYSALIPNN